MASELWCPRCDGGGYGTACGHCAPGTGGLGVGPRETRRTGLQGPGLPWQQDRLCLSRGCPLPAQRPFLRRLGRLTPKPCPHVCVGFRGCRGRALQTGGSSPSSGGRSLRSRRGQGVLPLPGGLWGSIVPASPISRCPWVRGSVTVSSALSSCAPPPSRIPLLRTAVPLDQGTLLHCGRLNLSHVP